VVRRLLFVTFVLFLVLTGLMGAACKESSPPPDAGTGGQGGSGGSCPVGPVAMFTLTVTATDGPVPPDTSITVSWSAGQEPMFVLSDPTTWKTLDDGTNVVCHVDRMQPPPSDLAMLVCDLWTSGPTLVKLDAQGYETHEETFSPEMSEPCGGPVPTEIALELMRPTDAGTTP
jgi:hypothetical protein